MGELTGGLTNYYLVEVLHPQREDQDPYQAECEDIAEALQLTPNEFCEFKAIWRTAAARLGNGKPGQKALYDAQKRVHYATRDLKKLERELQGSAISEDERTRRKMFLGENVVQGALHPAPGTVMEDGWIVHEGPDMPEPLSNEQYVEVRLRSGVEYTGNFAKRAMDWVWAEDNSIQPITHYRLLRFSTGDATVGELDHGKELVGEPGWYQHAGGPRPAGVAQRDRVQVRLSNGHTVAIPREAFKWHWEYRQDSPEAAPHIEAWRFV